MRKHKLPVSISPAIPVCNSVPGRPTNFDYSSAGPTMIAVGAGEGLFGLFMRPP